VAQPTAAHVPDGGDTSVRPPAIATVLTTLRREERVRTEMVVRRTTVEIASPPTAALPPAPTAWPGDVPARTRAQRRAIPTPPAAPAVLPESEVARLADRVVQRIERRVLTERERMGRR
jgi:hypothetical protein